MNRPALQLDGIVKRFGTVTALAGATLLVRPGSVHALLGENGAGKTTLMRIAFGLDVPDEGSMHVDGRARRVRSPAHAIAAGIGMVQQHFTLVPALSVLENVTLGLPRSQRMDPTLLTSFARRVGLSVDPFDLVANLDVRAQQRLELLKVIVREVRLVILDEPTAALTPGESHELFQWLRQFADQGGSVVLITHKLREAFSVADDITVLRHGRTTLASPREQTDPTSVIAAMLGRAVDDQRAPRPTVDRSGDVPVAQVEMVDVANERGGAGLRSATVEVAAGEVLGVVGVEGSGHRELLRLLAGRIPPVRGRVQLPATIGFVPEDRHREAIAIDESVADNIALRDAGRRRGLLDPSALFRKARVLIAGNDIVAPDVRAPISSLSGGNQQRLVVARELDGNPPLVVVENPTRGLDVNAANQVRRRLLDAADRGAAIVYYSADIDEVFGIADRVVVTHAGAVQAVERDRAAIGRAMLGAV